MQRSNTKKRGKGNRQKAWEFIRRNRVFRVGDIMTIIEMSESSLKLMIRQLSQSEHIKIVTPSIDFKERQYKLIRNTGVICPMVIGKNKAGEKTKLWDKNIDQYFPLGGNSVRTSKK